jgi:hypothetical protein
MLALLIRRIPERQVYGIRCHKAPTRASAGLHYTLHANSARAVECLPPSGPRMGDDNSPFRESHNTR